MRTEPLTDLDLVLSIEALFDEEQPCENANHDVDSLHSGPGAWYLTAKKCPHCKTDRGTRLICDSFAQYLLSGGPVRCGGCFQRLGSKGDVYRTLTKKSTRNEA